MKITKLGHCAMVLEIDGLKILTDPGNFTIQVQEAQQGVNVILITHEHGDHFHIDSIKKIIATNPGAVVITNAAVAALIAKESISVTVQIVGDGESTTVNTVTFEGMGKTHAQIYGEMGQCENTAYFVANKFYFPGDNFHAPGKPVDVLALPVAGPWMKISEALDFAKLIKARVALGVHDGMIVPSFRPFVGMLLKNFVPQTEYISLQDGETREF